MINRSLVESCQDHTEQLNASLALSNFKVISSELENSKLTLNLS